MRKVLGGNGSGTPDGLAPYAVWAANFFFEDLGTLVSPNATMDERLQAAAFTFIKPAKILDNVSDVLHIGDSVKDVANASKKGKNSTEIESVQGNTKGTTKPLQKHHYATNKSKKYTPQIENITKKYGLDLDDEWNKELLPHQGRHPNAYHDYVLDKLSTYDRLAKGDREKFLKLYEGLKQEVRDNPDMLYKEYWRSK